MSKTLKLAVIALCCAPAAMAQEEADTLARAMQEEQAFTFTESQLGADETSQQDVSVIGSNRNVYASEVGYRFSPVMFKYRAYNSKYSDTYINGNPVNDAMSGQIAYSALFGGLNNQTRTRESSLPFEDNNYMMTGLGIASNFNFRPSSFATGHRLTVSGANRADNVRALYTYNSGVTEKGWAFTGSITGRWGDGIGYIDGTFSRSMSYFLGIEKMLNDRHAISFVTWGAPTERGGRKGSTDEMYWIANDRMYNPSWGYQDGKKRNAKVMRSFSPSALFTWDWDIDDDTRLTTTLFGKYAMWSNTRLSYNGGTNPEPDYYSLMPSFNFNVWNPGAAFRDDAAMLGWQNAYDYLSASEDNRQIQWDKLYYANSVMAAAGQDAMYYLQREHEDQLSLSLATTLEKQLTKNSVLHAGLQLGANKGMFYQTMEDLLGNATFHNINTYAIKSYGEQSQEVSFDMNEGTPREIKAGDRFGHDYVLHVRKAQLWAGYSTDFEAAHLFATGRLAGTTMQRDGKMRNGLAPDNSYGKSGTAKFLDGGAKVGAHVNLGQGNVLMLGMGYELKTPTPKASFSAPRVNNDFVKDLKQEKIFSAEMGYQLQTSWLKANLGAYYSHLYDVTEQTMYYSDYDNSFAYATLSGIEKMYCGLELGMNFRLTEWLNLKALGVVSEAKYVNNADMRLMLSNSGDYVDEKCINSGMREGNTPLTAGSIDLSFHSRGWYFDLIGNYYDRIYLYYSPDTKRQQNAIVNDDGEYQKMSQAEGKGGFMLDASLSRQIRLKHGRTLGFNLMMTNLLNNTGICTGGYEKSRQDLKLNNEGVLEGRTNNAYVFGRNPIKYYAQGINGMFMVTYRF